MLIHYSKEKMLAENSKGDLNVKINYGVVHERLDLGEILVL